MIRSTLAAAPGVAAAMLMWATAAHAQVAPTPATPAPTSPDAASPSAPTLRPFCPDRPSKANGACILDQGHWQVESDLANVTYDRTDGITTETYLFTSPTLKYGLTHDIDVEASWTPYEAVHTYGRNAGGSHVAYGVGDVFLRSKIGLVGQDSGALAVTLLPYVKIPTAPKDIGNRVVEGGLIVPIVIKLSDPLSLSFGPELDSYKNANDDGQHANMQQLVNLTYSLPKNVGVFAEFWSNVDFDPTGTVTQYSADFGANWGLPNDLQLDAGVNIGLNRDTPAVQGYFGVSHRF